MPQHPFAPVNPKQPGTALLWGRICLKTVPNSRQVRFPYGLHCSTTQEIWSTWSTQVCSMSTSQVHKSAALSIDDILLCKLQFAIVSVAVGDNKRFYSQDASAMSRWQKKQVSVAPKDVYGPHYLLELAVNKFPRGLYFITRARRTRRENIEGVWTGYRNSSMRAASREPW